VLAGAGKDIHMKATVWTRYGPPDVLQLREMEKPMPKDDEILIRIHATTVTAGDCELRSLRFPVYLSLVMRLWRGVLRPRGDSILGTELAGGIEAVGKDVTRFSEGDQVFGSAGLGFGANAEYICLPEQPGEMEGGVTSKPASMTTKKRRRFLLGEGMHCTF
jgi:NADPH:quinone reductase-like Zn-dependent oxidoreductase